MPMRWDPFLARAVARELDLRLRGARVRALSLDRVARRVLLYMREGTLVCELHPRDGWIALLPPVEPDADLLDGARPFASRIVEIRSLPDESAIVVGLQRIRGRDEGVEIVLEFVANRWNAVVVGHRSRHIRDVLLPRDTGGRALVPGAPWVPLPTGGRAGEPDGPPLDGEPFDLLVAEGRGALLAGVANASSLNVDALLASDGWAFLERMRNPDGWSAWITASPKGRILYPIPIGSDASELPSLLDGMALLREEERGTRGALLPGALAASAEGVLRELERKVAALRRRLDSAPDPAELRARGDLILARFGEIPAGAKRVTLVGFDGEPVDVELDPARPVHENAARVYADAGRAERALATLPTRIAEAEGDASAFAELLEGVRAGALPPAALAERLGAGEEATSIRKGDARSISAPLPYRRYRSSGGLEIRVGKGARKNDELTFRHAAPDDIWLHVREAPGAHVVLRWGRKENPPARELEEAAILAALSSEAKHSGVVPVDWTRRKYVRKPRKAAPGAVVPERVRTVFVEPDPALPERLKPSERPAPPE